MFQTLGDFSIKPFYLCNFEAFASGYFERNHGWFLISVDLTNFAVIPIFYKVKKMLQKDFIYAFSWLANQTCLTAHEDVESVLLL